jgi:cation diffusion facilitator family transporter
MHDQQIKSWQHQHTFNVEKRAIEKRTFIVVIVTLAMMIAEILVGWVSNSMALLADGWHMGTHAFALGVSLLAYILARTYSTDQSFTFGTWKIEILGAYTSALVLGMVGFIMVFSSLERLLKPLDIHYNQALLVAIIGLLVNLACAFILNIKDPAHEPQQSPPHDTHDDLNLKSAYLHVVADALTSVLAMVALLGAKYFHYNWLDPLMGMVGAILILSWAASLIRNTAGILLEREMDYPLVNAITALIESDDDTKISDLHLWKVAQNHYACIVSLVSGKQYTIEEYKKRLSMLPELVHVIVEKNLCKEGQKPLKCS